MRKYLLPILVAAFAVGACSDSTGSGTSSVVGTYALISIDGTPVPVVIYEDDFWKDEVLSGAIVLNTGGSCTITIQWRETDKSSGVVETEADSFPCTYTVSGSTITFSFFGETLVASLSGNTLTVNADGEVWVFRK